LLKNAVRRITAIVLIFCLLIPFIGILSLYHIQKKQIRKEVHWQILRGMKNEDLVVTSVTTSEIRVAVSLSVFSVSGVGTVICHLNQAATLIAKK
jgi:hypothetical protein